MTFFRDLSIKNKIILLIMLNSLFALVLACTAFVFNDLFTFRRVLAHDLEILTQIVGNNCNAALLFSDHKAAEEVLSALSAHPNVVSACIYTKDGKIFATYFRKNGEPFSTVCPYQTEGYELGDEYLIASKPILFDDDVVGYACIKSDLEALKARMKWYVIVVSIIMLLAISFVYVLSSRLQKWVSRPLENLTKTVKAISEEKDYSVRAKKYSDDEVGMLIDGFNEMISQIQQRDSELELHRKNLEKLVAQRTRELERANEELKSEIKERKRIEEKQARLLEELESVNQELKDFAYVVSHDLKAPLRAITTLATWISEDYKDKLDDAGREQLELLIGRVKRMHNLIDGILEYSRVGRIREERVKVDLNNLVKEIIEVLSPPPHIDIIIKNSLPTIYCERTRVQQVFQNLLSNAVKFMDKPRGLVEVGCIEERDYWKFYVKDNGPGIDKQHYDRIFQIFQTLNARDDFESTGIGLTVVKKIIDMYGGKIWIESEPGLGTTFFFSCPKKKRSQRDENENQEANSSR